MTIAVTVKVHDGIVVASDSATTMRRRNANGQPQIVNIYNNANKIFNLRKGFPVGSVTAGAGSIGHSSIATLSKDLRSRLSGGSDAHGDWALDRDSFTMDQVASRAKEFLYDEKWRAHYGDATNIDDLHFWVFGYSAQVDQSELWKIHVHEGQCAGATLARCHDETGIDWAGQTETISRLLLGYSPRLEQKLLDEGRDPAQIEKLTETLKNMLAVTLYTDPMPIIDAIDLAEFLVHTTIMFSRFDVGAATVGGPIEVAAITRHEQFKWVSRKHYFNSELNPEIADA